MTDLGSQCLRSPEDGSQERMGLEGISRKLLALFKGGGHYQQNRRQKRNHWWIRSKTQSLHLQNGKVG